MLEQVRGSLLDPQPDMARQYVSTVRPEPRESAPVPFAFWCLLASMAVALVIAAWYAAKPRR